MCCWPVWWLMCSCTVSITACRCARQVLRTPALQSRLIRPHSAAAHCQHTQPALPCTLPALQTIAALPPASISFEGIKVQIKGRMSGKGGMTSKRVWTWGRTSTASISDPVDYAHEAVITRAGYIGIKVRPGGGGGRSPQDREGGLGAGGSRTVVCRPA
jgi:hypothetical protein